MSRQSPQVAAHAEERHEELFLSRYAALSKAALRLTAGDRARAEDLVQDAFVHFTVARPPLERVGNLDGYLYVMLRNLNTSQARRAARLPERALSAAEYESAELLLRAADPREAVRTQDELRQVCRYACARKETSKAGSVLILRFFHGYYPREIALVAGSTRESVEERLRLARNEARQFLKDPSSLRFMREAGAQVSLPTGFEQTSDELLADLRRAIFDSRRGDCPTTDELEKLYGGSESAASVETKALAHVVSCPRCIDEANRLLGIAPLSERYPTDTAGADARQKDKHDGDGGAGGGTPTGGVTEEQVRSCRRRARDLFEHRPSELCVAVNGRLLAAQKTGAARCEQRLTVTLSEDVEFVEVFSEQEVRLLFLDVNEHFAAGGPLSASVPMSDDRRLQATLSLEGQWPTVQVVYEDSTALAAVAAERAAEPAAGVLREAATHEGVGRAGVEDERRGARGLAGLAGVVKSAAGRLGGFPFWLRPAGVTAALAVLVCAALLFTRLSVPTASAAELLRRAATAEDKLASDSALVLHRTFQLEESMRHTGGMMRTRLRVEVWQSAARGLKLRRVFGEDGRLLAVERQVADGSRTVYVRGERPRVASPAADALALAEAGEAWRLDLSAKTFSALVGEGRDVTVEDGLGAYVLDYRGADAGALARATLRLSKSDLRATVQSFAVRRADGEEREYRFVEGGFERLPAGGVAPEVFEPDAELGGVVGAKSEGAGAYAGGEADASSPAAQVPGEASAVQAVASRELEVEVAYLLSRIKADLGEQVSWTRTTGGQLRVEALAETEARKEEILRALGPVINNPAVRVDVSTVAERAQRSRSAGGAETVREVEVKTGLMPADSDLRRHLAARGVAEERLDADARRIAARAMSHSRGALLHASALKRLVARFTPEEARSLSAEARAKWVSMVRGHAQGLAGEVRALDGELRPVFSRGGAAAGADARDVDPARAAARLLELSYTTDESVRAAFTVSQEAGGTARVRSPQFWRSLREAAALASAISEAYAK
jgi:RNA polymerase sigma factor (sigma-70 family)